MKDTTDLTLLDQLDELVAFEPNGFPFISLYLNMQPDQHGRDNFKSFVRKEFNAKTKSFAPESLELASFKRDTARIRAYLRDEVRPSANGWRFSPAQAPMTISMQYNSTLPFKNTGCTSMRGHTSIHSHV
jgi:hypothetical protein